jgi:transposase
VAKYQRYLDKKGLRTYLKPVIRGRTRLERGLELKLRKREIEKKERTLGKIILFADREDWTSEKIMRAYNDKYLVEENFRFLKDRHYLRFEPVYHWTDQKIRVHALMCVLGLLLVKLLQLRLAAVGEQISVKMLLDELNDITEVAFVYPGPRVVRKLANMSTVQTQLWQAFGLGTYFNTG